jgi:hypothetical protein
MNEMKKKIIEKYKKINFIYSKTPSEDILYFKNIFSIHYVFLFDTLNDLKNQWKTNHDNLIEDYIEKEMPRYMGWNYYAVFMVKADILDEQEWKALNDEIENDTSYSRKYLMKPKEINELPPGMLDIERINEKSHLTHNIREEWERTLGAELYRKIMRGPKAKLKQRILNFIEEKN